MSFTIMQQYRFSPIKNKEELFIACAYVHLECYRLCKESFNMYFANAGNMTICCHYADEFEYLTNLRKKLTEPSDNPDQKFFRLYEPIVLPQHGDVPETAYPYLYIRKPREDSPEVGDIDFYADGDTFAQIKNKLLSGEQIQGARIYDRSDLDMIELYDPASDVLGYISTKGMTEKVRVKQSDATIL